jgi:hypothetical protein
MTVEVLEACGDDLTRDNLLKQATKAASARSPTPPAAD